MPFKFMARESASLFRVFLGHVVVVGFLRFLRLAQRLSRFRLIIGKHIVFSIRLNSLLWFWPETGLGTMFCGIVCKEILGDLQSVAAPIIDATC
jgi:hypothetical protein